MNPVIILGGLGLLAFLSGKKKSENEILDVVPDQPGADEFEVIEQTPSKSQARESKPVTVQETTQMPDQTKTIAQKKIISKQTGEILPVKTLPVSSKFVKKFKGIKRPINKKAFVKSRTAILNVTPGQPVLFNTLKTITRAGVKTPVVKKTVIEKSAPEKPSVIRSITRSGPSAKPVITDIILNPIRRRPKRKGFLPRRNRRVFL